MALPRGLGHIILGRLWIPTYPLVLPSTIAIMGGCASAGAGTGLHALGAARRSLRAMCVSSAVYVIGSLAGAFTGGAAGTMRGAAVAAWIGAMAFWWELNGAMRDYRKAAADKSSAPSHGSERSGEPSVARSSLRPSGRTPTPRSTLKVT